MLVRRTLKPHPPLPAEVDVDGSGELVPLERIPGYAARHQVTPGLAGLAQAYAARDIPRRHKFKFDCLYIAQHTFWLALKLLILAVWLGLCRRGERFDRPVSRPRLSSHLPAFSPSFPTPAENPPV
jgi:hypothetical protein